MRPLPQEIQIKARTCRRSLLHASAADAALAAAITQTVVEPHLTTLTGCPCFLYLGRRNEEGVLPERQCQRTARRSTRLQRFGPHDRPRRVPGWRAGFEAAHERFGSKSRRRLMAGAIRYARDGFETHPFLWGEIFVSAHKIGLT